MKNTIIIVVVAVLAFVIGIGVSYVGPTLLPKTHSSVNNNADTQAITSTIANNIPASSSQNTAASLTATTSAAQSSSTTNTTSRPKLLSPDYMYSPVVRVSTARFEAISDIKSAIESFRLSRVKSTGFRSSNGFVGQPNVYYVSLPSSHSNCSDLELNLPILPPNSSYHCVSTSSLQNMDGTGWIPVNFNSVTPGPQFLSEPIDPVNSLSSGSYFIYFTDTSGDAELDEVVNNEQNFLILEYGPEY